jgi:hypothetical protein
MMTFGAQAHAGVAALVSVASAALGCSDGKRITLGLDPPRPAVEAGVEGDASSFVSDSGFDMGSPVADAGAGEASMGGGDSGSDGGSIGIEAGPASGPFGSPVLVSALAASGSDDFKETLTSDMLELYFLSTRPGGPGHGDVWVASRAHVGDPWGPPHCVLEVSSPWRETSPAVSPDGLTLWVASDRPGGRGGYDVWVSNRPNGSASWSIPTLVAELSSPGDEIPRPPGESGLVMPLAMGPIGSGIYQTYTASRPTLGAPWTMPSRLSSVDTAGTDTDGFLSEDGLVLYFSSDRIVAGDQDLFIATRPDRGAQFASFAELRELNTKMHQDRDPWLSPDGREIYLSSDRGGTLKIYHATR